MLFFCSYAFGQNKNNVTLSGYVFDGSSGEELIAANIYIDELQVGATSNKYGFYSVTIPNGNYKVKFSYVGYKSKISKINLDKSTKLNIDLFSAAYNIDEVVVEGERRDQNVRSSEMGTNKIVPKDIQSVPIFLGEQDILKTMQLMPGVSQAGEGNSGFFVRGGQIDQNLILLDEATVYNPSHLLGFFSVFNSDAIKNAKMIKGNMPPEYGGRISSVLDIKMREGNYKKFKVNGGIGLISSRLTLEAPIVKDKGSFLITGRRTYVDLALQFSSDEQLKQSTLYFYDLNLKANYRLGSSDNIFLSGYFGRDVFKFKDRFGFDWGNITSTLRWNHLFSDKLFLNTSIIYSDYNYLIDINSDGKGVEIKSGIRDINYKNDFEYFSNLKNTFKFGVNGFYHTFIPGEISVKGETNINEKKIQKTFALETAFYLSHQYEYSQRIKLNYGIRYSGFTILGPGDVYSFDEFDEVEETTSYKSGEIIKYYGGLEPRFSSTFLLDETSSLKISYARNRQYLHLLSNSTTSTPLDIWQPSTKIVQPEIADQVAIGYFKNFDNNKYETSIELYYKNMQNQVDYKNGADILLNELVESQLVFGKGWSYGVELFIKKRVGNLTGWISYTLSKTQKKFDDINNGTPYSARQDRTHDLSLTGIYRVNDRWTFSANWIYYTGDAVTYPSGKYDIDGSTVILYTDRNAERMPDYHRMDIGATWILSKNKTSEMSLSFSIYNIYGRKNAYKISFRNNEDNYLNTEAVKLSLFSIVPAITFNFRF
ncbi:MAG: TonB-dependent receptor [Melioribacteraceae bacterium]